MYPEVIQGGMGVAVSNWTLARAVSQAGQLGVVSGTVIDVVFARRLMDGDPGGHMRRALAAFPDQTMAGDILDKWFRPDGRAPGEAYAHIPMITLKPNPSVEALNIVANFAEVWLAKEGHDGVVGLNLLTKIAPPTLSALYGAMLAGVDYVIMGAGIPAAIPGILNQLAQRNATTMNVDVDGSSEPVLARFDPSKYDVGRDALKRPKFLAVISSVTLATYLYRDENTRPDGFVVELPVAGGHNAPPRGAMKLDEDGQPIYGPKDEVDLTKIAGVGLPFWVAGAQARPDRIDEVKALGACGVQIGTAFATCAESGLAADLKLRLTEAVAKGDLTVFTDPRASASGYPFKVVAMDGTLGDSEVYEERERVCDLGFLRTPYVRDDGNVGYRCGAEPVTRFIKKGGTAEETEGRKCLCNGLVAAAGYPQVHEGHVEPPIVTLGDDVESVRALVDAYGTTYTAKDVLTYLGV